MCLTCFFFFSSRRRHTRCSRDWSSDVCSSDLDLGPALRAERGHRLAQLERHLAAVGLADLQRRPQAGLRSEERRVGEEGRSRWAPYHLKKKKRNAVRVTYAGMYVPPACAHRPY